MATKGKMAKGKMAKGRTLMRYLLTASLVACALGQPATAEEDGPLK
jgi:hypothetical protein